jgi:hypothetical protein
MGDVATLLFVHFNFMFLFLKSIIVVFRNSIFRHLNKALKIISHTDQFWIHRLL